MIFNTRVSYKMTDIQFLDDFGSDMVVNSTVVDIVVLIFAFTYEPLVFNYLVVLKQSKNE